MKIGVFDSGVGGVSILKEIIKISPNNSFYYLSDSKNNPYGDKSKKEIKKIVYNNVKYLIDKKCEIIVLACNTATAVAIDSLRKDFENIIFVGTEPAIKMVFDEGTDEDTLLLATKLTLKTERVKQLVKKYNVGNVQTFACVGLADLIEKAEKNKIIPYFEKYLSAYKDVKRIVLGCTHYVLVKNEFSRYFKNAKLIDGSAGVAKEVLRHVTHNEAYTLVFHDTSIDKNKETIFKYYLGK